MVPSALSSPLRPLWQPLPLPVSLRLDRPSLDGRSFGREGHNRNSLAFAAILGGAASAQLRSTRRCTHTSRTSSAVLAKCIADSNADVLEGLKVTDSHFCHGWTIAQLQEGYRYCADDILCAHLAVRSAPGAKRMLDMGSGIGTIGLSWLAQQPRPFRQKACTMLEAQSVSVALCRRTLRTCQIEDSVDLRHGDLRETLTLESIGGNFDVVTANPPYFTREGGVHPSHSQRAHCRHELRGGVLEFCQAAATQLAPDGHFCIIHAAPRVPDVLRALETCGFCIRQRVNVFFRGNCKSVAFVCKLEAHEGTANAHAGASVAEEKIEVQDADGTWSPGYVDICRKMGL